MTTGLAIIQTRKECKICKKLILPGAFARHTEACKEAHIPKECPVCHGVYFKKTATCSYSCANKKFKSGENNGNWKDHAYRSTCFSKHKKECVICKEKNIVEVHHADGDHSNNVIENLVPLCPTHHKYMHSRYAELILPKVEAYIKQFIR